MLIARLARAASQSQTAIILTPNTISNHGDSVEVIYLEIV